MLKIIIPTLAVATIIVASNWYVSANANYQVPDLSIGTIANKDVITSFADCVEAGNPIMESYPEQCRTKDGRHFTNTEIESPIVSDDNFAGERAEEKKIPSSETASILAMRIAVREKISQDLRLTEEMINILTIKEQEWPDGCLGLPDKDEMCIMMMIPGYEITVVAKGKTLVYRTDLNGTFVKRDTQL